MLKRLLLICGLVSLTVLCGCQSAPKVPAECPQVPALNIEKESPTLTEELLNVLSASPNGGTAQSAD